MSNENSEKISKDSADVVTAEVLKAEANKLFLAEKYEEAIAKYTDALSAPNVGVSLQAVLTSNISACYYKLKDFKKSLKAAEKSQKIKPNYAKAFQRGGLALLALDKPQEALEAYNVCMSHATDPKLISVVRKQSETLAKKLHKSAVTKIEEYCAEHKSFIGCTTAPSSSMFTLLSVVAEGNYSHIYKSTFNLTGEYFALKEFVKRKIDRMSRRQQNVKEEVASEAKIMKYLGDEIRNSPSPGSDNIVKLYQAFEDNSNIYFCYEYINAGEVWQRLRYFNKFNKQLGLRMCELAESEANFYLSQLATGMKFLHSKNIIHRDIKPENLLVQVGEGDDITDWNNIPKGNIEVLKIVDFGSAFDIGHEDKDKIPNYFVGTPEYMANESINGVRPSFNTDLWAFACIAYQLHTGWIPFKGATPYMGYGKIKALHYYVPSIMKKSLLKSIIPCFTGFPEKRTPETLEFFEKICPISKKSTKPIPSLQETLLNWIGDKIASIRYTNESDDEYLDQKFTKLGLFKNMFEISKLESKEFSMFVNGEKIEVNKQKSYLDEPLFWNKEMHNSGYPHHPMNYLDVTDGFKIPCASDISKKFEGYLSSRGFLRFREVRKLFGESKINDPSFGFCPYDLNSRFDKMFNILYLPNTKYDDDLIKRINSIQENYPKLIIAHNHDNTNMENLSKLKTKYQNGLIFLNSPDSKPYFSCVHDGIKLIKVSSALLNKVPEEFVKHHIFMNKKPKKVKPKKPKKIHSSDSDNDSESSFSDPDEPRPELDFSTSNNHTSIYDYSAQSKETLDSIHHFLWLQHELLSGEYNFRHLIVFSEMPFTKDLPNLPAFEDMSIRQDLIDYFVPMMKKANTHMALSSGKFVKHDNVQDKQKEYFVKESKSGVYDMKMLQSYMEPVGPNGTNIRWIKVLDIDVKQEIYDEKTLPKHLIITEKKYENEGQPKGTGINFDSFSSSSESEVDSDLSESDSEE